MSEKHNKHKGNDMSTAEQEKIIEQLRSKIVKVKLGEAKTVSKIDKKKVWIKAEKVGKSISDDSLSTPHTAGSK